MALSKLAVFALLVQAAALLAIGVQLRGRLHSGEDFILGRRRLGPRLGGISLTMNAVPMWWLLFLTSAAYTMGRSALWLALALLGGVLISGWHLAPRLRLLTAVQRCGTVSELLIGDAGEKMRALLVRSALLIVSFIFISSIALQLQLAGQFLANALALSFDVSVVAIGMTLGLSLLLAGFWTTTIADAIQAIVWFLACGIALTALAIALEFSPAANSAVLHSDWFGEQRGLLIVSFMTGVAFIAGDAAGQTPMLARYMACSDDATLLQARRYALLWSTASVACALSVGWGIRSLSDSDTLSLTGAVNALSHILSPSIVTLLLLSVFGAATMAIGNSLLAATAHAANDLRRSGAAVSLTSCRLGLVLMAVIAVAIALYLPPLPATKGFERLLFCWHALGAAFGPLLIVRLSGKRIRPGSSLGSIWSGFLLTIVFYLMPDTPGELLERGLPFATALGVALSGGERRRNPDRADRGERTVHDRLPI